jgi:hypothetical protein
MRICIHRPHASDYLRKWVPLPHHLWGQDEARVIEFVRHEYPGWEYLWLERS